MLAAGRSLGPPVLLSPGFRLLTFALPTSKAGMLLMHKGLTRYVAARPVVGSAGASDPWLLAPDFSSGDERSRNLTDAKGHAYLSRSARLNGGSRNPQPARSASNAKKLHPGEVRCIVWP
jgi:hypothetical protein